MVCQNRFIIRQKNQHIIIPITLYDYINRPSTSLNSALITHFQLIKSIINLNQDI